MDSIKDQNDWADFRNHLNREMDRQVTSNKTLLWVGMTVLLVFNIVTLCVALTFAFKLQVLENDISNVTLRLAELGTKYVLLETECTRKYRR